MSVLMYGTPRSGNVPAAENPRFAISLRVCHAIPSADIAHSSSASFGQETGVLAYQTLDRQRDIPRCLYEMPRTDTAHSSTSYASAMRFLGMLLPGLAPYRRNDQVATPLSSYESAMRCPVLTQTLLPPACAQTSRGWTSPTASCGTQVVSYVMCSPQMRRVLCSVRDCTRVPRGEQNRASRKLQNTQLRYLGRSKFTLRARRSAMLNRHCAATRHESLC
eukprot:2743434-Rhodomonas_salina.2